MDEQFNKHLNDRIREVFENFEDHSADKSWLLLRKKFPENKKDRGAIWLWMGSAAAILLLLLGIGTGIYFQKTKTRPLAYQSVKKHHYDKTAYKTLAGIKKHTDLKNEDTGHLTATVAVQFKNHTRLKAIAHTFPLKKDSLQKPPFNNNTQPLLTNKPAGNNNSTNPLAASGDTVIKKSEMAINSNPAVKYKTSVYANNKNDELNYSKATVNSPDKKVEFSVYAATYFNYAKGSDNQLNLGAGITSDIKLTKNLKISTGIAIAQNTLNYANYTSKLQQQTLQPQAAEFSVGTMKALNSTATMPVTGSYNAQLLGLDIPVDLKYEFNPQKGGSYIMVGLNSGTFINQSYTYQYKYPVIYPLSQNQTQTTNNNLSDFYFAKTLNVSFGLGYLLGKNRLIVEPFLRYPLDGLGARQIRFGAGGLNLKFDLLSQKK